MSLQRFPREEALAAAQRAAAALGELDDVQLVFLFGSAAAPDGPAGVRDVDLGVLVAPSDDPGAWRRVQLAAERAARLPVDLVPLHRAPVALAREIVDAGICLFARSEDVETDFVTRARARYWDFRPFLDRQWELSGQRAEQRVARGTSR
jgi:predicted nucleotidyltransferase